MSKLSISFLFGACLGSAAFRSKLQHQVNVEVAARDIRGKQQADEEWPWRSDGPSCSDIIQGAEQRKFALFRSDDCSCPYHWVVGGSDPACAEKRGSRFFPLDLPPNVCNCEYAGEPKDYVPIDHSVPRITAECAVEYGYTDEHKALGLPDFLESAHEWCRSSAVPEDKRVPPRLRGLYWMKDLQLDDVAFCPSLGEWDEDTLTVRMSVWNMFVFGKNKSETVSHLAEVAANLPVFGKPLVYSIKFTNASMTEAHITTNVGLANLLIDFPMTEIEQTPDGTVTKEKDGDIFYRPSSIAWFETGIYFAVRIMEDDGTKNLDRYKLMQEAESLKNTTFQHFKTLC